MDLDRAALHETDIALLIARHSPMPEPLTTLVYQQMPPGDQKELEKILAECSERAKLLLQRAGP